MEFAGNLGNPKIRSLPARHIAVIRDMIDLLIEDESLRTYHLQLVLGNSQEELIELFMKTRNGQALVDNTQLPA